jgi:hypothetical protein
MSKRGYFELSELLSKVDYDKYGVSGWRFIDAALLDVLNRLRGNLELPMTCNDWIYGGGFNWRGVRTPGCDIYSITSAHAWGRAMDFDVKSMTPKDVVKYIIHNRDEYPEIKFIEIDINWVHIDVMQREQETDELQLWSPTRGYVDINTYMKED